MEDKVIIVTGANNGIELGLTRAPVGMGHRVAGLDLSVENLDDGGAFVCDVTYPERVETVVGEIL